MEKLYHVYINQRKAGVHILLSDKVDSEQRNLLPETDRDII